jgi:hypothetical protein
MLKKVVRLLRGHPIVRMQFPNREKMRKFTDMVKMREPMVDDIKGFMDGLSFPSKCTNERVNQSAMYCGYKCDTMVNNVFAYCPDRKVFIVPITFLVVGQTEV